MPTYTIKRGGVEYDVDGPDQETAVKDLNGFLQAQMNEKAVTEVAEAPAWQKPLLAAQDITRVGASMFGADKLADYMQGTEDEAMKTQAIMHRMGILSPIAQGATAAAALPTAVPRAMAAVGGGPAIRGVTGLLAGGTEGAVYGGTQAALQDKPVQEGAIAGGAGGMLGQTIASAIGSGANKLGKWWTGASDVLPAATGAASRITKKTAAPKQVEAAVARAEREGGGAGTYREKFREIRDKGMQTFTPEQRAGVTEVIKGDPGTKMAYGLGGYLSPSTGILGALGTGLMEGGVKSAIPLAAVPLAGAVSRQVAGQGVKQSVEDLRRAMLGIPKYEGVLSKKQKARLATGLRGGILDYLEE